MTIFQNECVQHWSGKLRLSELHNSEGTPVTIAAGINDETIVGLTCDSRQVEPGFLFAALPGSQVDGRTFIADAMARGAIAVLAPDGTDASVTSESVPLITDPNPRRRYSLAAAQFYETQPNAVMAITGTNGKTSVAGFTRQILAGLGHKSASAGTLGVELAGFGTVMPPELKTSYSLTTPDSVDLHKTLAALASAGVDQLAIEASSHGLDQYRLDGLKISSAAFTNLSRDHLDYHGTFENYLDAKLRLFSDLVVDGGAAVINADDMYADAFRSASQRRGLQLVSYGVQGQEIELLNLTPRQDGQQITMRVFGNTYEIMLPLVGAFQAANALCALGLVVSLGENIDGAVSELGNLQGIAGRLERIGQLVNGAAVYVDFAHTPDALAHLLAALRSHTKKNLVVVFGCGGDRDPGKRPEMGEVAGLLADKVIITDDNPRNEDPAQIRAAAMATCPGAIEIADRQRAIETAINELGSDDVLVVAGKGHEKGQVVGDEILAFDDRELARSYVVGGSS